MALRCSAVLLLALAGLPACHDHGAPAGDHAGSDKPAAVAAAPLPPPTSEKAMQIAAMVDKAVALVEHEGKDAAFAEFRKRGSEWFNGDTYLFAYDMQLNVLLNPAFPQREGTNVKGQKDANGKQMHDEFANVVRTKGSGWVDYVFQRPGGAGTVPKWSYVKAVTIDGVPGIMGAGFYP